MNQNSRSSALVLLAVLVSAGAALAQTPIAASTQFDITGIIQEATLDSTCTTSAHCGGTLKVNGHVVTVPKETIVMMPANALTWQEVFAQAPAPFGIPGITVGTMSTVPTTGMALADCGAPVVPPAACTVPPLANYEARVVGNRVIGATDLYIAGLIYLSQHALNSGQGFITSINYLTGEMLVGPAPGTRVRLNDPAGRYGRAMTPDKRFTSDADNPTITGATGYPMCVPRSDPAGLTPDGLCPQSNRPPAIAPATGFATVINMSAPAIPPAPPLTSLDPTKQAPFEVGDYITFAGTLVKNCVMTACAATDGPTAGPWPALGTAATYISAHTISANVAIYTAPGTDPAYVKIDVGLIGTGGLLVLGATEPAVRTRFEGFMTDPTRIVHLFGLDLTPTTGAVTERDWGAIGVDPGLPAGVQKGRWRFRPPCTGTFPPPGDKICSPPPGGTFLPPTRELRARIQNPTTLAFSAPVPGAANGLITGQYHAPIFDYIFTENIIGQPIVQNDFTGLAFLAQGGYISSAGTIAGVLNPWPGATAPPPSGCTAPTALAGGPYSVAATGSVTLAGAAGGTAPFTFLWTATAGTFSNPALANAVYTAPAATGTYTLTLQATNSCGTSTSATTVNVLAAGTPIVTAPSAVSVLSGANGSFSVSGTSGGTPITWTVAQIPASTLLNLKITSTGPTTATVSFTAPILGLGVVTPTVVNLTTTATSAGGSASATTTVTVNPVPDTILITLAEYRTGKQRLILNATSSIISPNVVLTLQPYLTTLNTIYDPATLCTGCAVFTNNGGGLYVIDLVGAPEPAVPPAAPLQVKSNLGGASPFSALTRIRQ